jgi:O-acetyl-ADP-ribose deacetylase (regulator of RNase III)
MLNKLELNKIGLNIIANAANCKGLHIVGGEFDIYIKNSNGEILLSVEKETGNICLWDSTGEAVFRVLYA